jgi:Proteasome maturation factor UMP1
MTDSGTIPVLNQPVSSLEAGPNSNNLAAFANARHPVDSMQRQHVLGVRNPYRSLDFARQVYGSGFAMTLATEEKNAYEERREKQFVGLHLMGDTSSVYGDIVSGQDVSIDFKDYLSLPDYRPDVPKQNPHSGMERALGM